MRKNEKKSIFSKIPNLPILSFWDSIYTSLSANLKKDPPRNIFFVSLHVTATSVYLIIQSLRLSECKTLLLLLTVASLVSALPELGVTMILILSK